MEALTATGSTATFGIDLAAQSPKTAACLIEWHRDGTGLVHCPQHGATDEALLERVTDDFVTRVAIDAPFGWPNGFIDALCNYREAGAWPDGPDDPVHQQGMRLRATDLVVQQETGLWPLSVSTDRIGVVAMRCARLISAGQERLGQPLDRSGEKRLLEVYPAAALQCWQISPKAASDPGSYKGKGEEPTGRRQRILDRLVSASSDWLEISEETRTVCVNDDDCLDALISALVARAADRKLLRPVSDLAAAQAEGWIRLPQSGSLGSLGRP